MNNLYLLVDKTYHQAFGLLLQEWDDVKEGEGKGVFCSLVAYAVDGEYKDRGFGKFLVDMLVREPQCRLGALLGMGRGEAVGSCTNVGW